MGVNGAGSLGSAYLVGVLVLTILVLLAVARARVDAGARPARGVRRRRRGARRADRGPHDLHVTSIRPASSSMPGRSHTVALRPRPHARLPGADPRRPRVPARGAARAARGDGGPSRRRRASRPRTPSGPRWSTGHGDGRGRRPATGRKASASRPRSTSPSSRPRRSRIPTRRPSADPDIPATVTRRTGRLVTRD